MRKNNHFPINILGLIAFSAFLLACSSKQEHKDNNNEIANHEIVVDGEINDWNAIPAVTVEGKDHLWIGEGLPEGQWAGKKDLSYSWKTAWNDRKIFFLFKVKDDTLSSFNQQYAWLNDCIEIYVDPQKLGGSRIKGIGSENTLEDRIGKQMRGYEMQFLPSQPLKVFIDDSKGVYYTNAAQNALFKEEWQGEVATRKTNNGYLMEIAFAVPGSDFQSGQEIGLDIAVCDDDGSGRKSLLLWSGYKGEFWLTMDNFNAMELE